jgi:pimeloyl-ACP methyl ester carboxylesterase
MNQGVNAPRLRRAYFECRHGQLHVHNAIPAGGGFDEQTTLVCLHGSGTTGRVFLELSRLLGVTRSVYSPDLPGCGESDAPPKALPMAGYADDLHTRHLHFEHQLHGSLDVRLGGVALYAERVLVMVLHRDGRLFGDVRGDEHIHELFAVHCRRSSSIFTAPTVASTLS